MSRLKKIWDELVFWVTLIAIGVGVVALSVLVFYLDRMRF